LSTAVAVPAAAGGKTADQQTAKKGGKKAREDLGATMDQVRHGISVKHNKTRFDDGSPLTGGSSGYETAFTILHGSITHQ
jgi:hypothetical protein